jgi:excisionase family DNA binding protein
VNVGERDTLSVDELAASWGVSRTTLYALAREGKLPIRPIRIGKSIRFGRVAVERLLAGEVEEKGSAASPES